MEGKVLEASKTLGPGGDTFSKNERVKHDKPVFWQIYPVFRRAFHVFSKLLETLTEHTAETLPVSCVSICNK